MIRIVDYGMGNLASVAKAFGYLQIEAAITADPAELRRAGGIVLPGVGNFGAAVRMLDQLGLRRELVRQAAKGKPFLGICLGMQLLVQASEEAQGAAGLGLLDGKVKKFPPGLKVPHIGWNQLEDTAAIPLLRGVPPGAYCYFVHSYYLPADSAYRAATTAYGVRFTPVVAAGNLAGVQFHPEKSGAMGLQILKNFGEMVSSAAHSGS